MEITIVSGGQAGLSTSYHLKQFGREQIIFDASDNPAHVWRHDRWFLDRICTHLIVFEDDSRATMHIGNWSDYEAIMKEKFGKDPTPHQVKYGTLKR